MPLVMTHHYSLEEPRDVILRRIKWLMILRLILATFSLGAAALIQVTKGVPYLDPYLISLYVVIGMVYALNLFYTSILTRVKSLTTFAYTQFFMDILLITGLVNATGGVRSVFSLFYYLSIMGASIILYRRGGIIVASASSIFYGLIINLEYYGIFQPLYGPPQEESYSVTTLLFRIVMNITAFYFIAILSSFLSEQVRKSQAALKVKEIDYSMLEALHRNIVKSINSGLLTVDRENRITFINRAAEEITGYSISEVYGLKIDELISGIEKFEEGLLKVLGGENQSHRFELSFTRRDGKVVHLGFSKSILKGSEDNGQGEIYIFQDITKLKEMEEHVKVIDRLAAIGRLAMGMAHEIRNPLASLSGSVQVLRGDLKLTIDNQRLMEIVLRETKRLDQLLSDFILFAHPNDRKKEKVELNSIIDNTIQLCLYNPDFSTITIKRNFHDSIMVEVDPQQIKQVFWNLFINAAQAMDYRGEIEVLTTIVHLTSLTEDIKVMLDTSAHTLLSQIVVSDTGCGIPEVYRDKIFDPFFTTKEKGIGLGLAIVYSIIESYRGTILVKSESGKGSQFTIYLPVISHHHNFLTVH